ncbi:MAG: disulfide bond formation protein B [Sulfuricellaceae bacterium]
MKFAFLRSARFPFYLALASGLGLTACGVLMAETMRLAACPLCIIQRMLYLSIAAFALFGLLLANRRGARAGVLLLMSLTAATGVFVAGFQTWLQRFARFASCAADYPWWEQLVDWAGERWPLLFHASGVCSDPAWKFLGLSIAEWSLAIFSSLLVFFAYSLFKTLVRRQP